MGGATDGYFIGKLIGESSCLRRLILIVILLILGLMAKTYISQKWEESRILPNLLENAEKNPNEESYRDLAYHFNKERDWSKALKYSLLGLNLNSNAIWLNSVAGKSYKELNNLDSAMVFLKKEIRINKDSDKEHMWLGEVFFKRKEYEKALDQFKIILNNRKTNASKDVAWYYVGSIYFEYKNKKKACDCWQKIDYGRNYSYRKHCEIKKESKSKKIKSPHNN
jgi:tetratricopeptide (TPR) repeat protein